MRRLRKSPVLVALFVLLVAFVTSYVASGGMSDVEGTYTQGNVPSGQVDRGNPQKIGGVTQSAPVAATNGNRANAQFATYGGLWTALNDGNSGNTSARVVSLVVDDTAGGTAGLVVKAQGYEIDTGGLIDRVRHSFIQSTTGITVNGAGATVDMLNTPMSKHSLLVTRTAGATDVVEIDLECWVNTARVFEYTTVTSVAGGKGSGFADGKPVVGCRYNVVTVGTGNTLAIDFISTR